MIGLRRSYSSFRRRRHGRVSASGMGYTWISGGVSALAHRQRKRFNKIRFAQWETIAEAQYGAEPEKAFDAISYLPARMLSEQWWMVSTIEDWPGPLRYWFDKRNASMHATGSEGETPLP